MYKPPHLGRNDLDELVALAGGDAAVLSLLDIHAKTLKRWRAGATAIPQASLKLLWYAGPHGRQAADADLYNEVKLLRTLTNSIDRQHKIPQEAEQFLQSLGVKPPVKSRVT
jgi:hypothetical protein